MEYGIKKEVSISYEGAVQKAREELQKEGFGVLTEIDVKATLKKKLDLDMDNYIILGACNPPLAHQALEAEQDIGLMLPCNVIVYEKDGKVYVSGVRPSAAMSMIENEKLAELASKVEEKMEKVISSI
ncbi:DUF302 domain-containing protein [Candidatus Woesearchaeota archaeon]|nr:DUF302 domain-containing protein [Candidatus Woesearchaeota archaeon]